MLQDLKLKLVDLKNPGCRISHFLLLFEYDGQNVLFHRLGARESGCQVDMCDLAYLKAIVAVDGRDAYYHELDIPFEQKLSILQYVMEQDGNKYEYSLVHGPNCIDFITEALAVAGIEAPKNVAKAHKYYNKLCTNKLDLKEQVSNELEMSRVS